MNSQRNLKILIFIVSTLVFLVFYIFVGRPKSSSEALELQKETNLNDNDNFSIDESSDGFHSEATEDINSTADIEVIEIFPIHIMGEINNPGVYQADSTMIVNDLISLAGGLTSEADLLLVNLADQLIPYQKIYIPNSEEIDHSLVIQQNKQNEFQNNYHDSDKLPSININTANLAELQSLNGIGPSKAESIIEFRNRNGSFKTIEELMLVPGIKEASFDKIKDNITAD